MVFLKRLLHMFLRTVEWYLLYKLYSFIQQACSSIGKQMIAILLYTLSSGQKQFLLFVYYSQCNSVRPKSSIISFQCLEKTICSVLHIVLIFVIQLLFVILPTFKLYAYMIIFFRTSPFQHSFLVNLSIVVHLSQSHYLISQTYLVNSNLPK